MKKICLFLSLLLTSCTVSFGTSLENSTSSYSSEEASLSSSYSSSSSSSSKEESLTLGTGYYTGYYSSLSKELSGGQNGEFRKALTKLIQPKAYYSYSGSGSSSLSEVLQDADEDPNNSSNMIMFYTQKSIKKVGANGDNNWNREHCWPQSLSNNLYGTSGGGCDILHIRPTYKETNSKRGNAKYGNAAKKEPVSYNGIHYGYYFGGVFEPLDEIKGDCARIVLYMWVTYFAERGTPITNCATTLKTMINWSNNDSPSEIEKNRNEFSQNSRQKNRNPFVDHPEWVNYIFA